MSQLSRGAYVCSVCHGYHAYDQTCPRLLPGYETPTGTESEDVVNHPTHYTQGSVECIDAIKAAMSPEEYRGFLKGNCIKYLWRAGKKTTDVFTDLNKAAWYLGRLTGASH